MGLAPVSTLKSIAFGGTFWFIYLCALSSSFPFCALTRLRHWLVRLSTFQLSPSSLYVGRSALPRTSLSLSLVWGGTHSLNVFFRLSALCHGFARSQHMSASSGFQLSPPCESLQEKRGFLFPLLGVCVSPSLPRPTGSKSPSTLLFCSSCGPLFACGAAAWFDST